MKSNLLTPLYTTVFREKKKRFQTIFIKSLFTYWSLVVGILNIITTNVTNHVGNLWLLYKSLPTMSGRFSEHIKSSQPCRQGFQSIVCFPDLVSNVFTKHKRFPMASGRFSQSRKHSRHSWETF